MKREKLAAPWMWVWLLSVMVFSSVMIFRNMFVNTPLVDYTYQMENAYRIYCGQVPYKDFFLVLTPGTYYLMAWFMKAFGISNLSMMALTMTDHLLRLVLLFSVLRKITNQTALICILILLCSVSDTVTYPYPLYNHFFTTCMILYIWYDICFIDDSACAWKLVLAGCLATLPFFFKQNYGLFFGIAVYIVWLYRSIDVKRINKAAFFLGGTAISGMLFLVYLYVNKISLYQFLWPAFLFSAKSKNVLGIYASVIRGLCNSSTIEICLLTVLFLFVLRQTRCSEKTKDILGKAGIFSLWFFVPNVIGFFSVNDNIWYLICFLCAFIWINDCLLAKEIISKKSALLLAFFCIMFGYCSHGIIASTYLLAIIVPFVIEYYDIRLYRSTIYTILLSMVFNNIIVTFNVRYPYVNEDGSYERAEGIDNVLYGIGLKGGWLSEFEDLLDYIDAKIDEATFVEVPCEDPIYWASQTNPQLYFFQMYNDTCPLSVGDTINLIAERGIEYVIVKTNCQFKYYMINESNVTDVINDLVGHGYEISDQIGVYTILKRILDKEEDI